ncbi:Fanconi anemia group F protein, partial [Dillenia turbinata]
MGWSHPDISLEDLIKLIKGFMDILILASGYQSSGLPATWDSPNIKKAFQWGLFFEHVFTRLRSLDDFENSMKELDEALSGMKSNFSLPPGLANLTVATLSRARVFVLEHLIHALPLRNGHLKSFLTASIEMDLDELKGAENDCLYVYLEKLRLQNMSRCLVPSRNNVTDPLISSQDMILDTDTKMLRADLTGFSIQELAKRQSSLSCIESAEKVLDILSKTVCRSGWPPSENKSLTEQQKHGVDSLVEEQLEESVSWNCWKSRTLTYLLNKRTIRLVSGARIIFSTPKIQWMKVLEQMKISAKCCKDDMCDTIELLLLGCVASHWHSLIECFMSIAYGLSAISKQYAEVQNLLLRRSHDPHAKWESTNSK